GTVGQYASALGLLSGAALANTGMARLSAIENAQVSLEVMMGDASEANAFLDDVLAFAKTTPFAFPDLAETARNLVAFGMDTERIIPTMQAIGDSAAASGKGSEGLRQIASAFGAMQVAGTLSLGEVNRLMDAGIPALKILANQTGKSVEQIKKDISAGMYDSVQGIEMLVDGMQNGTDGIAGATAAMAGIMERTKDTWTGSVDSLKSSISSTMATIMEPVKPYIQDFMAWFGDTFSRLPDLISIGGMFASPIVTALSTVTDGGQKVMDVFSAVGQRVSDFIKPWAGLFGHIGGHFENLTDAVRWSGDSIEGMLDKGDKLKGALSFLSDLGTTIKSGFESAVSGIQSFVSAIWPLATVLAKDIVERTKLILPYIMQAFGGIASFVGGIASKMGAFWSENGAQIVAAVQNVGNFLRGVFMVTLPIIATIVQSVWGNIKGVISGALDIILGLIKTFSSLFTGDWAGVWAGVKQILTGAVTGLWNLVQLWFVGRIVGVVRSFGARIQTLFQNVFNRARASVSNAMDRAKTAVSNFFDPLLSFLGRAKSAWSDFTGLLGKFKMPEAVSNVISGAGNLVNRVTGGRVAGSHYHGLERVPYDGYVARLHKGETVLPREEAESYRNGGGGGAPTVSVTVGTMNVRKESDIDAVAGALFRKLKTEWEGGV
ncbi:tape measure protein, partial [Halalkalibacter oceani]